MGPRRVDYDGISDCSVLEFPITDTACLQINHGDDLARRLASVFGPARKPAGGDPVCVIDVQEDAPHGVTFNFEDFGPGCSLSCGTHTSVSDLLPWVNLLLPVAQVVSMHASGFTWKGEGVAVTGNAGSGKTGVLLAAIDQGASAVGDECLWLYQNASLRGLQVEMEIRADYFRELPYLRAEISAAARYRIYLCDLVARGIRPILPKLARKFAGKARAQVQPDIVRRHLAESATLDRLFISRVHAADDFRVNPVGLAEVVPSLVDIQLLEFTRQRERYSLYREEPANQPNEWMEGFTLRLQNQFTDSLRNTKTYIVEHPPSPSAQDLFAAIAATWR